MVQNFISKKGLKKNDKPFVQACDWRRKLCPLLTRMTGAPELFESTKSSLGLKDFRRLEIKKILDSGKDVDIKLRNIGE